MHIEDVSADLSQGPNRNDYTTNTQALFFFCDYADIMYPS